MKKTGLAARLFVGSRLTVGRSARYVRVQLTSNGIALSLAEVRVLVPGSAIQQYYYAGGQRIAERALSSIGGSVLYYLAGDHLGSTSATTCGTGCGTAGALLARQLYYPFGQIRYMTGTLPTDYGYTGQMLDDTGWMYYNARYYDPYLNRWTQPDTIVPGAGNPQNFNRYSYSANNPTNRIDPSGHATCHHADLASCSSLGHDYSILGSTSGPQLQFGNGTLGMRQAFGDFPYYIDFIDVILNPLQRDLLIANILSWLDAGQVAQDAEAIAELAAILAGAAAGGAVASYPGAAAGALSGWLYSTAMNTMLNDLEDIVAELIRQRDLSPDGNTRFTVGTNTPSGVQVPYRSDGGLGLEFVPVQYASWGVSVNGIEVFWHWLKPSFTMLWLMVWRNVEYPR